MGTIKTKKTALSVTEYLNAIESPQVKSDCLKLKKLFEKITKKKAALWGNNMVGFGVFHYKSERSRQEGDWPLTAFAARKQNITVYIMSGVAKYATLLKKLGTHKLSGGSCLYIKKLEDIDIAVLEQLIAVSYEDMKKKYEVK